MAFDVEFEVMIEIPQGSRNTYVMDFVAGRIRLDRMLFTATAYPADYAEIAESRARAADARFAGPA
ncbi:inorganic diphosphatase [Kitasatospora sp. NPDC048298]|uniref:inorganic diphosphatase n=1 Tax=Kitasatospora sp. NPDC048298 TaxID=3364049 RepID=UPI003712EBB1